MRRSRLYSAKPFVEKRARVLIDSLGMNRTLQNGLELSADEKRALLADLLRQKAARPKAAPTSFAQKRLWFLSRLEPDSPAYNIPRPLRMQGELNVDALRQTLNTIAARHEVLRGSFDLVDGHPVQLIAPRVEIELPLVDLSSLPGELREAEVSRLAIVDAQTSFDLTKAPLFRVSLLRLGELDHVLLLTMHHIISDGWSMGIFVKELAAVYQAISRAEPVQLPELTIQYPDFARWQREWLQGEVLEEQLRYWTGHLAGAPAVLNLAVAKSRPAMQTFRGAHLNRMLPPELGAALSELGRREGVTLFMTLLAAFKTLLFRYSGQEDLVVGSPIAGRNRAETEGLIGFFVNSLPLRTKLSGNPGFRDLLKRVRETALGAYAHQDLPFEKIVEWAQPERSLSYTPIFQIMFALQNQPRATFSLPGLSVSPLKRETDTAKYDLTLFVTETDEGLACWLEYNTDLFAETTVARLLDHYEVLLKGIVADPRRPIAELPLLSEAERKQVLVEWNNTRFDFPKGLCMHELFEAQVARTPDATALVCGSERLNYRELNARANRLANYLRRLGVRPEDSVAIFLERSIEMVISVLATLKAGGAYLPLDPAYPRERLAFTLQDARAAVLLTQQQLSSLVPQTDARVVLVDREREEIAQEDAAKSQAAVTAHNLAYVIYTSGSTGQPKGVAIEHASAVTFLQWTSSVFTREELSGVLLSTSLCFDLSVFELFAPLCVGGKVILVENALALPALQSDEVTLVNTVPSAMTELVRLRAVPPSVTTVNLAGEPLTNSLVQGIYQHTAARQVLNLYGPSEDTTYSTFVRLARGATDEPSIGRPLANTESYLLDKGWQPVPIGVPGELFLGGQGLARGYLNRGDLTAEKFVPHPFSREPGARLYRTGDLARYDSDGSIHFLGRLDNQVKLRGYRIELGEIETALREHGQVQDAIALVWESAAGNRDLVAYIVARKDRPHTGTAGVPPALTEEELPEANNPPSSSSQPDDNLVNQLKQLLKQRLPGYMIPAHFVVLAEFPLTPNGKLDRRALPAPDRSRSETANARTAPRDATEERLVDIWKMVLDIDVLGVNDNFFELGGHSLLAVRLMSEIEKIFSQKIPLVSLFQNATIAGLADLLRQDVASLLWPTVVEIQRGGVQPPIFCVSTPNVNALGYRSLARHLGPEQPVYGLQAQYPEDLEGEHSPAAVDELATEYMKAMRKVQPQGPYQFVGLCRGAHIAFEMARRLVSAGESVGFVGILDTWVLENTYNRFLFVEYYFRRLKQVLRLGPREQLALIKNKLQREPPTAERRTATAPAAGSSRRSVNPVIAVYFPGPDFVPRTYPGRVSVFRAHKQPLNRIRDKELGWGRLAEGGVDLHYVPGKHGASVLQEPNVQVLAAAMKKCLVDRK